ncbi:hypothetical protein TrCOL_g8543 [Triparma columacea]|uniref:G-protein coupled receptors family 3 profile domain-containing protein n=1 Tax=Triparma columacea TaxID=722753 RepID=A0A9W7GA87_9STRA|nr:hypothetical protein TrCOL_g8543 [Triparma columacea]
MNIFPSLLSFILIFSLTFVFTSGTVPGASHPECEFASTCWSNNYIKDHSCVSLPEGGAIINSTHIEIGISAVLSGGDAQWEIATNAATLLAIEEINNSNDILPGITIIPTFADDAALYIQGFLAGLCLSKRGVPVILGPTYSDAMGAAVIAARQNVPMLSPTCSTPKLDNRDPENGFPLFTRTFLSDTLQGPALSGIANHFGWSTVVTIVADGDAYSQGLASSFSVNAEANAIEISTSVSITASDAEGSAALVSKLNILKATGVRVIYMIVGSSTDAVKVLKTAKTLGMTGEGWTWVGCDAWMSNSLDGVDEADKIGIIGTRPDFDFNSVGWRAFETAWQAIPATGFHPKYDLDDEGDMIWPYYGQNPLPDDNQWPAYNYDAMYVIGHALHNVVTEHGVAKISDATILTQAIRNVTIPNGATAPIAFNNQGEMAAGGYNLYNYQPTAADPALNSWTAVGTISIPDPALPGALILSGDKTVAWGGNVAVIPAARICALDDYEYTISECDESSITKTISYSLKDGVICTVDAEGGVSKPGDVSDIQCSYIPSGSSTALVCMLCSIIGIVFGLIWVLYTVTHWKTPSIRTSQPVFCCLFALFIGLVNLTSILELGEHTDGACMIREVAFHIFFTLGFGAMLCKMHRVVTIFSNKSLKRVVIRDSELATNMAKLLVVDVIIVIVWCFVDPLKASTTTETVKGLEYEEISCEGDSGSFLMLAYFYKICLLLFGINLAYKSRDMGHFAESKEIAAAIYAIFLLSVIAAVAFSFMEYQGRVVIRAIVSLLATLTSLGVFFGPKFMKRNMTMDEYKAAASMQTNTNNTGSSSNTSTSDGTSDKDAVIAELESEIARLKKAAGES